MGDEDINAAKASRKCLISCLTRAVNTVERLIAEEDADSVREHLEVLKEKFKNFEAGHDKYHNLLKEQNEIDASEACFLEVHQKYVVSFKHFMSWVNEHCSKNENEDLSTPPKIASTSSDLWKILNTPKVRLDQFDGDPLKFHCFLAIFDECVHNVEMDDTSKLTRLIQATTEDANAAIRPCALIGGSKGYNEARRILESRFGNRFLVSEHIISNLRMGRQIRTAHDLIRLADELSNAYEALVKMDSLSEIDSQNCVKDIVGRLELYLKDRWKKLVMKSKENKGKYPDFKCLVDFVRRAAEEVNDPVYGKFGSYPGSSVDFPKKQLTSLVTSTYAHPGKYKNSFYNSCVLCQGQHRLFNCEDFKKMKVADRIALVRTFKLCENCLLANHDVSNCRKLSTCSVPGCGRKHTKFIHVNESSPFSEQPVVANPVRLSDDINLPVVPVVVNGSFHTYALLDTGSTNTFCSQALVDELGVKGMVVNYNLNTLSHTNEGKESEVVFINLNSHDGSESLRLSNVYVADNIPVRCSSFARDKYPHLNGLPIVENVSKVDVLIGQDNSEALIPIEVKRGDRGDPFAVRTMFGWSLNGSSSMASPVCKTVISNSIVTNSIGEKVAKLCYLENGDVGVTEVVGSQNEVIKLSDDNFVEMKDCLYSVESKDVEVSMFCDTMSPLECDALKLTKLLLNYLSIMEPCEKVKQVTNSQRIDLDVSVNVLEVTGSNDVFCVGLASLTHLHSLVVELPLEILRSKYWLKRAIRADYKYQGG